MTTIDAPQELMNPFAVAGDIGGHPITLETGRLAQQAHGAVTVTCGETILLATAVMSDQARENIDFLPLTVEFEERLYAVGKIPGSFFRREGRPGTEAILSARLTDRSIRPLFPKGLHNEVQVIITVLSVDEEHPPETLGMVGVSAALSLSQIPFDGPIGACRVTWDGSDYRINASYQHSNSAQLNMIVASNRDAIMMVESGSVEVSEEVILEGIRLAHENNVQIIELIDRLVAERGSPKTEIHFDYSATDERQSKVDALVNGRISEVLERNSFKSERDSSLDAVETEIAAQLADDYSSRDIAEAFKNLVKKEVRGRILSQNVRPDGRKTDEIRPITCSVGELPRVHGSGLFTRGQTQVLSIATLASLSMRQTLDTVGPDNTKQFMHHYNFPPYSVGEARRVGSPGRREIGHGALAERAIQAALPPEAEFPYTIRVVSEVLASNGSTSMGSVCGSSMALMDAGVPLKAPVAGIAMGLITDDADGQYAVLSDIQGIEDFLGDMDFKVAGTAAGVNALQMDIKWTGLTQEILAEALEQARVGRLYIMDRMAQVITTSKTQMSPHAPKMIRLKINSDKIGALIGPGGRVIRGIQEETGTSIDVQDDGTVTIGGVDQTMLEMAHSKVDSLTRELTIGDIFTGKVVRLTSFGAFIELVPGRDGLIRNGDLGDLEEDLVEGQEITVMIHEIDSQGRVNLSRRALFGDDSPPAPRPEGARPGFDRGGRPGGDRGGRPGGFGGGNRGGGPRRNGGGGGGGRPMGGGRGPGAGPGAGGDRRFDGGGRGPSGPSGPSA
jgi:polyribonucleotide nucleotidyltransferase